MHRSSTFSSYCAALTQAVRMSSWKVRYIILLYSLLKTEMPSKESQSRLRQRWTQRKSPQIYSMLHPTQDNAQNLWIRFSLHPNRTQQQIIPQARYKQFEIAVSQVSRHGPSMAIADPQLWTRGSSPSSPLRKLLRWHSLDQEISWLICSWISDSQAKYHIVQQRTNVSATLSHSSNSSEAYGYTLMQVKNSST